MPHLKQQFSGVTYTDLQLNTEILSEFTDDHDEPKNFNYRAYLTINVAIGGGYIHVPSVSGNLACQLLDDGGGSDVAHSSIFVYTESKFWPII